PSETPTRPRFRLGTLGNRSGTLLDLPGTPQARRSLLDVLDGPDRRRTLQKEAPEPLDSPGPLHPIGEALERSEAPQSTPERSEAQRRTPEPLAAHQSASGRP
ncbi:uncharacterized protein PGTG_17868, partial [Puccinia graminis f. sp. tritici CRL 75-36-700-3]